jgi:hypothetical protein
MALDLIQKGASYFDVIDGLEEAKEPRLLVVDIDIVPIDDGGDAPHNGAILYRHIGDDLGMEQKRVFRGEVKGLLIEEGRNPVGISLIDLPGETEEGLEIFLGLNLLDGDLPPGQSDYS